MSVTVMGYDEAIETLRGIDIAIRAKLVRNAVKSLVSEAAGEMQARAPRRRERGRTNGKPNQRLRSRLGSQVKGYRDGVTWWGGAGELAYRRGRRHAHLVEFGHRIVTGGTVSHLRYKVDKRTGQATPRTYTPKARNHNRTGKGRVLDMTQPRPFMGPIITRYMGEAPERLRAALAAAISAHVAGGSRG